MNILGLVLAVALSFPPITGKELSSSVESCYGNPVKVTDYDLDNNREVDVRIGATRAGKIFIMLLFSPKSQYPIGAYVLNPKTGVVETFGSFEELQATYPSPCLAYPGEGV